MSLNSTTHALAPDLVQEGPPVGNHMMQRSLRTLSSSVTETATMKFDKTSIALSQLALDDMSLHGREDHLKLLKSKLRDFTGAVSGSEGVEADHNLLLISGASGTGKTALVKKGLEEPAQKMGLAFAWGKFDLNQASSLPLSAFSAAMDTLTQHVAAIDKLHIIQKGLKASLQDHDIVRIIDALPGCKDLFNFEERTDQRSALPSIGNRPRLPSFAGKEAIKRLQHAICEMLKSICSNLKKGLVLFIDDLQWSDFSTIELLRSITIRKDIPSLVVGAYRNDEISDSHPLMIHIKDPYYGKRITTLEAGKLSCNNVRSLIAEALRMEGNEDAVTTLASTIYKKTDGVAFYVLVFLKSIYDEDILQFNIGLMRWTWDDGEVEARFVTENVATIMIDKLKQYDEESQKVLQVGSCLGATFSIPIMEIIIEGLSSEKLDSKTEVKNAINQLMADGLIETERGSLTHCCFCHDKIQSSAFALIPSERRNALCGNIGNILLQNMNSKELEENLFTVVSLRNCDTASLSSIPERQELAKMNLTAGLMASKNAAFDVALSFYRTGRNLLDTSSAWETDKDTILQLFSNEAKACYVTGDLETMNELISEVISKESISITDKFAVYEVKINAANSAQRFQEAITTAIKVRRQLGLRCPSNKPVSPMIVLKEFVKTTRMLGSRNAEDIANLPLLNDERIAMGQRILDLMNAAVIYAQPTMYPILVFRMVRESIKHGVDKTTCIAFAAFGTLLCGAFGKFERGREMAKAVDLLLENPDHQSMQSMCMFMCENFIYHWSNPIQATFAPLLSGYQKGLETGDLRGAGFNIGVRCAHLWYAGRPLAGLLTELEAGVSALTQMNEETQKYGAFTQILAVKELQDLPYRADEKIESLNDITEVALATNNGGLRAHVIVAQLDLHVIFQDWDSAKVLVQTAGNIRQDSFGSFNCVRFTVLEALTCLKGVQESKNWLEKNKWKRRAKKIIGMIQSWLKKGCVNVTHWMHLLTAESCAIKGKRTQAMEMYKAAIIAATRFGYLQDKAIAHELAGRFYVGERDAYWARYHLDRAEESFAAWGATAKVEQIAEQKELLLMDL